MHSVSTRVGVSVGQPRLRKSYLRDRLTLVGDRRRGKKRKQRRKRKEGLGRQSSLLEDAENLFFSSWPLVLIVRRCLDSLPQPLNLPTGPWKCVGPRGVGAEWYSGQPEALSVDSCSRAQEPLPRERLPIDVLAGRNTPASRHRAEQDVARKIPVLGLVPGWEQILGKRLDVGGAEELIWLSWDCGKAV